MFPNWDEHKDDTWIVLKREPKSPILIVAFENGDSFEMDPDEVKRFLELYGMPEGVGIIDYVWNFYAAKLHMLEDWRIESLSQEQAGVFTGEGRRFIL